MTGFDEANPIVLTVYFSAVAGTTMFSMNPVILLLSFLGALSFFIMKNGARGKKKYWFSLLLFAVLALVNPLVSHNGVTVLFVMNNAPITLEALFYGLSAAVMVVSVLYWFFSFSSIMTSDKLLYVFGFFSPKIALIFSMALRYVQILSRQTKKIKNAQKAIGLYREDNVLDTIKANLRIFSILITWGLENGIITADSMAARGYGKGKRTHFSIFRFAVKDYILLFLSIALFGFTQIGISGAHMEYYPAVSYVAAPYAVIGYVAYGVLCILPVMIEGKENLKWKYLTSKI